MNKIIMETREQWYKPNLLYNIHWRPPREPDTPKIIVETVQFNPSVCTCGQHDCQPRYRMERRVVWLNKEKPSTKQNMEGSDEFVELHKSKNNDSKFDEEQDENNDEENKISSDKREAHVENSKNCSNDGLKTDGNMKTDSKQRDCSNVDNDEKDDHGRTGSNKIVDSNLAGVLDYLEENGGGENIGVGKCDGFGKYSDGEFCHDTENGYGLKMDCGGKDIGSGKGGDLGKTSDRERDERDYDDERDDGLKTDVKKHGGGENIGGSKCDGVERTGQDVKEEESFIDGNGDTRDGLKTDDKRHSTVDDRNEIHIVNRSTEINVRVSDIIHDRGCNRAAEGGERYSDDAGETDDDDRREYVQVQDDQKKYEDNNDDDNDDDISPAFGILSIYCNSGLHCVVTSACRSNTP